nr:hypothetical protein Iba_chr12dCG4030 [Ipomoea batatas]
MVLSKSNGYDPTVAAQPANAPLMYERYGLKLMWKPDFEDPEAKVLNLCNTVNCMAVYGMTISRAGTLPRQKPCKPSSLKMSLAACTIPEYLDD